MRYSRRMGHLIDEHEDLNRWLISYADLITLLFAFFVLMYAASHLNEQKYKALSKSLESVFSRNPISTPKVNPNMPIQGRKVVKPASPVLEKPLISITEELERSLKPLIEEGQLSVRETHEGVAIEIKDTALFESGRATLPPRSVEILGRIAQPLQTIPNEIRVEGFTDNVPIRNPIFPSNWELSAARAGSVVRLFTEQGVSAKRLVAMGYAGNFPVDSNLTPEGRAKNRRVSITILSQGPGVRKEGSSKLRSGGSQEPASPEVDER